MSLLVLSSILLENEQKKFLFKNKTEFNSFLKCYCVPVQMFLGVSSASSTVCENQVSSGFWLFSENSILFIQEHVLRWSVEWFAELWCFLKYACMRENVPFHSSRLGDTRWMESCCCCWSPRKPCWCFLPLVFLGWSWERGSVFT